MPGDDVIHPIYDRWGRLINFDFCSEVEPTETRPYMTWVNPDTGQLKVRNRDDSGWITIGGTGGGGAPTDALYLTLAFNPDLSAERRLVPSDGLQAVDGGTGGDYTLNIDVSDFAGAGLEDDGAENLRIAAAAAGDGLTGGGGVALAVDSTVLRTYSNISGVLHWDYDGLAQASPQTVIPDGSGDVTEILWVSALVSEKTGSGKTGFMGWLEPGESRDLYSDGTDLCYLTVAANGSVTVTATATDTFKVSLWLMWI